MRTEHYLIHVLCIAPKSRTKVCAQWRMALNDPVASGRSKVMVLV